MKESSLKKKVREELSDWVCWFPPKVRFAETDIFGIADVVCIKSTKLKWIQYTTKSNMSARVKKILSFFVEKKCYFPIEVWGYDKEKRFFKKVLIKKDHTKESLLD